MLSVEFPKTHDLQALLLLLRNSGISAGQEIEQAVGVLPKKNRCATIATIHSIGGRSSDP